MIIDGHAHAAGVFLRKDTLVAELDRLGVDKIVLAPMGVADESGYEALNMEDGFPDMAEDAVEGHIHDLWEKFVDEFYEKPNQYLAWLKTQCPERIIQYYWANPKDPHVMQKINDHYAEWNFSGIKLQQMVSTFDTDQQSMHDIADFCEAKDMPCFIHLWENEHVLQFIELMTDHQHTQFIVGHMIGYNTIKENALGLDNFWWDISPKFLVPTFKVRDALKEYGASRIMLGSDTPIGGNKNLQHNIERVRSMGLSAAEQDLIMGDNLKAMLKL
jgi:predicted TIM-barrel fold metal-dependent hydrolase